MKGRHSAKQLQRNHSCNLKGLIIPICHGCYPSSKVYSLSPIIVKKKRLGLNNGFDSLSNIVDDCALFFSF